MPPNIVLILIDDLGWRDLSCQGSTFYETPHLDRLARQGMRFTDAYAASPVCSPTRAALLTGKSPARVGITQWIGGHAVGRLCDVPYHHGLPLSEISLASALRRGGYQTWHVGKWHLGEQMTWPTQHGFDVNIGGCGWGYLHNGYFSPWGLPTIPDGPDGEYLTDRLTSEAIRLMRDRDPRRPFFLNLWHYAVHTPIQAPADLVEKYRRKAHDLALDEQQALVPGEPFACQHKQSQRILRRILQSDPAYAAMIENLDANVGRVLAALDAAGLADQTIVIFTSDNGGLSTAEGSPTCNRPLAEGKGWMYEGGTRICQIVRWPERVGPGSICTTPTISMDWYPTLLDAAGLPPDPQQHADGLSLLPLLERGDAGSALLGREALYWHYPHYSNQGGTPACSVRAGDHKLIEFFEDGRAELYNLRDDIEERRNLAHADPHIAAELAARLAEWRGRIGALVPPANPDPFPPSPLPAGVDPPAI